jgi:hypothetical protein
MRTRINHLKNFKKKVAILLIREGNWDELIDTMIECKEFITSKEQVKLPKKRRRDGTVVEVSCNKFDVAVVEGLKRKGIYNENNQTSVAASKMYHFKRLLKEFGIMKPNGEIDEKYYRELLKYNINRNI